MLRLVSLRNLRVAVALSGGVDSAVAAVLLKQQGHEVIGVHSRNWDSKDENGVCQADADYDSARRVAEHLKIELVGINCVKEYWTEVFEPFLESTQNANSFNIDQLCNERIKFDAMLKKAKDQIHFDKFATGHYASIRKVEPVGQKLIATASDSLKDQTFYLSRLSAPQIENVIFPLGSLNKNVVKAIATENGLEALAMARESMGVCFIGKRRMSDFLSDYLFDPFSKKIFDIDSGKFLGKREFPIYGVAVGQRTKFQTKERNHRKRPIAVVVGDQKPDAARAQRYTITALIRRSEPLRSLFGSKTCGARIIRPRKTALSPYLVLIRNGRFALSYYDYAILHLINEFSCVGRFELAPHGNKRVAITCF